MKDSSSSSSSREASCVTTEIRSSPCAALIKAALTQLQQTGAPLEKEGTLDPEILRKRTLKPIQQSEISHSASPSTESEMCEGSALSISTSTPQTASLHRPGCTEPLVGSLPTSVAPCAMLIKTALAQFHQKGASVEQEEMEVLRQQVLKPVSKSVEPQSALPPTSCASSRKTARPATRPVHPSRFSSTTPLTEHSSASETKCPPGPAPTPKLTFTASDLAAEVEARQKRRASAATIDSRRTTASSAAGFPDDDRCGGAKPHPPFLFNSESLENNVIPVTVMEAEDAVVVSSAGIPVVAPWPIKNASTSFSFAQKRQIRPNDSSCDDVSSAPSVRTGKPTSSEGPAQCASRAPAEALTRPSTAAESTAAEPWLSDVSEGEDGTCSVCISPPNQASKATAPSKAASLYRIVTDPQEVARLWKTLTCRYTPE